MSSYSSSDVEKLVKLDWARRAGELCWFHAELNAWLTTVASGSESWIGWSAVTAIGITLSRWQPWTAVCDASEKPFVRWFCNATTSAAFNELDRAALLGLAEDCAFVAEPLDGSASLLRLRKLLLQATLAASAIRDELQIGTNDRVALYVPNHPQVRKLARGMSQKQGFCPCNCSFDIQKHVPFAYLPFTMAPSCRQAGLCTLLFSIIHPFAYHRSKHAVYVHAPRTLLGSGLDRGHQTSGMYIPCCLGRHSRSSAV